MDGNISLADISAVLGNKNSDILGGSGSMWIFALLILLMIFRGGFGGFGGGNGAPQGDWATKDDVYQSVQRSTDFQALERQNNETVAAVRQGVYDVTGAVKDGNYNMLGEIRDLQNTTGTGFANMQTCCCETNQNILNAKYETARNIDSVRYDMANFSAAIQANDTANTQKVLDALATNRMADMQNQINQLQIRDAVCGIPRVSPYAYTPYAYAPVPGPGPYYGPANPQ